MPSHVTVAAHTSRVVWVFVKAYQIYPVVNLAKYARHLDTLVAWATILTW